MTALPDAIENRALQGVLALSWADGSSASWTHAALRAACPCAECRARRRAGLAVEADDGVRIAAIEPVGAYALNLGFTDGHRRGIFPFEMLGEAGREMLHADAAWSRT
ncbi:DUF971 domain-containing protein [Massilia niastensis]|uniref:DUF971 domain-containing protein n=1 Tax=Massilia niastensis TaxID=544911 RepID=UPI0003720180|nr:DUF971 domain-containing protein [Massilia niastensis]